MHLMLPHKLQIMTIVVSVFVYSCYASDGSVVSRLVDHTQNTVHHQSNRPPESPTKNGNYHTSSSTQQHQQKDSQQQQQQTHSQQKPTHSHTMEKSKSSYAMLSQAMSEAVHHEFNSK